MMNKTIPKAKKIKPNTENVIIVDLKEGIGLHAGSVYYLNFEFLSFSTFSLILAFSSSVISIFI